jgi:diguanylate cyclase (GGDEF)-like protein
MSLDATTLTFAGGFVTFLGGLLLLAYWWQDRAAWAAFWWALANCGLGTGITLLALHSVLPFYVSNITAPLLLDLCAVLAFVAARVFNRGSIDPYRVVASVAAWVILLIITGIFTREQFAAALGVGISGGIYAAAAVEFWLGRKEELRGRLPIMGILISFSISLFLLALQFATASKYSPAPSSMSLLGVINFVGFLYALGVTTFLIIMLKGRNEEKYRVSALVDPLTGLGNRRAFMDRAQRMFDRHGHDASPVALLAFDLDRFKRINDTFGHATGDQVLCVFADVLSSALRSSNIVARIGGEEFVAVVPGASDEAAVAIASRIADAFQNAAQFLDGQKIEATVSVGVASNGGRMCNVVDVLASADGALYQAKNAGRNRVVLAGGELAASPTNNVVRIA